MARRTRTKKSTPEKRPVGRPTKLNEEITTEIMECARLGMTDKEICAITKVPESTLNLWKTNNASFYGALKRNKYLADRNVEDSLYMNALGHTKTVVEEAQYEGEAIPLRKERYIPPNTAAAIFWLKNRQPDRWRDKVEIEQQSKITLALDTGEESEEFSV